MCARPPRLKAAVYGILAAFVAKRSIFSVMKENGLSRNRGDGNCLFGIHGMAATKSAKDARTVMCTGAMRNMGKTVR